MSTKTGFFLSMVLVHLGLSPTAAVAQGTLGPLQPYYGFGVASVTTAGSLAYFTFLAPTSAYPPQYHDNFYRTDGTPSGTFSIDRRGPVVNQSAQAPILFVNRLGDLLFFITAKHATPSDLNLWRTNGSRDPEGTIPVTQGLTIGESRPVPERNLLFFAAGPRSGSDFELWATDGTPGGTRLVLDINPAGPSNPGKMIAFAGRLYFVATTPQGRELWRSDGTPEGTEHVLDLDDPDTEVTLTHAGGALFVLVTSESDTEIWKSDGTAPGTARILELPAPLRSYAATGRHLFLSAWDTVQHNEIWSIDGRTGTSARVLQIETTREIPLFPVGDRLAFSVEDDHGQEPWWSDGTPAGTRRIDVCPGPCSSSPVFHRAYGGRALLMATDGVSGTEPWLTDGTAAGTYRLGDLCPGECSSSLRNSWEIRGWLMLFDGRVWISDGTRNGIWTVGGPRAGNHPVVLPDKIYFMQLGFSTAGIAGGDLLPVTAPAPPPGDWMTSPRVPGFRFKVQVGQALGRQETACVVRTVCVSGGVAGRAEVFLRVADPKPDGQRWPSLVKLTTSAVDVWIVEIATGSLRHYQLPASVGSALPGYLDRKGFPLSTNPLSSNAAAAFEEATSQEAGDPKPPGTWLASTEVPGFRVQARLTSNGQKQMLRKEPCTIDETFCLRGAAPGLTELLVRVTGPKPNQYYWPMLARFSPAMLEVWIEQKATKKVRYYKLNAPAAESPQLDGFFDRLGFKR